MICKNCGKEHNNTYASGEFCSQFCARSYATKFDNKNEYKQVYCIKCGKIGYIKKRASSIKYRCNECKINYCKVCNKPISLKNKSGYCLDCIRHSIDLSDLRFRACQYASLHNIKNHKYWQPRNQISYAEKFWIKVLNNNNISYKHDYIIHINEKHWYYLDFYIEINDKKLDLEIDGKQHEYEERKIHDIERDQYLKSKGYLVYRIKWNEINSEKGSLMMKDKIDNFINYYQSL